MKKKEKEEVSVFIEDFLFFNKNQSSEIFGIDKTWEEEDLKKPSKLQFIPPGRQDDYVYCFFLGLSAREMIDAVERYNMQFISGSLGPMISMVDSSFSETNKKGSKLAKISSMPYLLEKDVYGWRKANFREALEIVLLLLLQSPTSKEYCQAVNLLRPYFTGYHISNSPNNPEKLIGLKINNLMQIELFEREKEKIESKITRQEIAVNAIWIAM